MTLRAISIAPNNYENPIESDRTLFDSLAKRVAGVVFEDFSATQSAAPELKVVPGTGHTVKVQPGKCVIREKSNPQWRGGYWFTNDADEVVNLPVPESNPFIATVIARVADPQYGAVTGAVGPRIDVVPGTPASNPVAVSDVAIDALTGTPGGWKRLSDVRINTADTGAIPAGQFTDRRTPGGFGVINCWSSNRPVVTGPGVEILEMDTLSSLRWNGSKWWYIANLPAFYVRANTGQVIQNTTMTQLTYNVEEYDTHNQFDIAGNDKFTCSVPGWYEFKSFAIFDGNTTGFRAIGIWKNDSQTDLNRQPAGTVAEPFTVESVRSSGMAAGETMSVRAYQNAGGPLGLHNSASTWHTYTHFWGEWKRPL